MNTRQDGWDGNQQQPCYRLTLAEVYDIRFVNDPQAKKSRRVRLCIVGDNDSWFETILWKEEDCEWTSYFISRNTGRRVKDEPPTGASRVYYLTTFYRMQKMNGLCSWEMYQL